MSLEDFQLLDDESFDNSIIKRAYLKIYHQKGAQKTQEGRNIGFTFGENHNYLQIGNGYLNYAITVRKSDCTNFHSDDPMRSVNDAFPFCFGEAQLSTSIDSEIEHNKFCGQVSTIMRVISNKDGALFSQLDNINENYIPVLERLADLIPQIRSTPQQQMLINNHTDVNKSKIKGYSYLEDIFGFGKKFEKVTKNLGFHLILKTAD